MRRTRPLLVLALAASMPVSGCATTYLGGEYRTTSKDVTRKEEKRTLAKGNEWMFFWGLLDSGHFDLQKDLRKQLREDECVTDLEVKDRLSIGGFFLWIITAGIVSHHTIVAKGHPAVISTPPPERATGAAPARERETIIVPAQPVPAGAAKSADYNEGYKEGLRDKTRAEGDRTAPTGRSSDYMDGYRDGMKDSSGR